MEASLVEELRPVFAGRKVVLTGGPLAALTGACRRLRELGAERPFLLATGVGTGEVPGAEEAKWCVVEIRAPDVIAEIRAAMRMLRMLPGEVVAASTGGTRSGGRWSSARCSTNCRKSPGGGCTGPGGPSGGGWRTRSSSTTSGTSWA